MLSPQRITAVQKRLTTPGESGFSVIPAGYTYIGQMISHDIVPTTVPNRRSRKIESPALQLDSIYGGPPGTERAALSSKNERFKRHKNGWDLFRSGDGVAQIPEGRNDDNIVIAQLHLIWQRIHNALLNEHETDSGPKRTYAADVHEARHHIVLLFQLLVVEDFLRYILHPEVYDSYFRRHERHLGLDRDQIPAEFTHAAFRFGHSMVRSEYMINSGELIPLKKLLNRDRAIPKSLRIGDYDWSRFFDFPMGTPHNAQAALPIDTHITHAMTAVRAPLSSGGQVNTVRRNLEAGMEKSLDVGIRYVNALLQGVGYPILPQRFGLTPVGNSRKVLGMEIDKLPLWPYILLEAEVQESGDRLGVLGSLIVAETIQNAIKQASPSIYVNGRYEFREVCERMGKLGIYLERNGLAGKCSDNPTHCLTMFLVLKIMSKLESEK